MWNSLGYLLQWRDKWLLAIAMIVLSASNAHADFFYKLVGYECDKKADAVILTYAGAYNEAGKEMRKNKGPRQWDPWKLVVRDNVLYGRESGKRVYRETI